MRLALLGLTVAVLGLLAVLPVAPQPVDLLLLEAQLDVILELVVLGVSILRAVVEVDGGSQVHSLVGSGVSQVGAQVLGPRCLASRVAGQVRVKCSEVCHVEVSPDHF